jgi:hypothetical protein
MNGSEQLNRLIDDTEAQLTAAIAAATAGSLLDLSDLVPRLERLCAMAVAERAIAAAPRLARLISRLDELEAALRDATATATEPPDPKRAAALYRAASPPDETDP